VMVRLKVELYRQKAAVRRSREVWAQSFAAGKGKCTATTRCRGAGGQLAGERSGASLGASPCSTSSSVNMQGSPPGLELWLQLPARRLTPHRPHSRPDWFGVAQAHAGFQCPYPSRWSQQLDWHGDNRELTGAALASLAELDCGRPSPVIWEIPRDSGCCCTRGNASLLRNDLPVRFGKPRTREQHDVQKRKEWRSDDSRQ
jgi:hypothetical protein